MHANVIKTTINSSPVKLRLITKNSGRGRHIRNRYSDERYSYSDEHQTVDDLSLIDRIWIGEDIEKACTNDRQTAYLKRLEKGPEEARYDNYFEIHPNDKYRLITPVEPVPWNDILDVYSSFEKHEKPKPEMNLKSMNCLLETFIEIHKDILIPKTKYIPETPEHKAERLAKFRADCKAAWRDDWEPLPDIPPKKKQVKFEPPPKPFTPEFSLLPTKYIVFSPEKQAFWLKNKTGFTRNKKRIGCFTRGDANNIVQQTTEDFSLEYNIDMIEWLLNGNDISSTYFKEAV